MSTYVLVHGAWHGGWCWSRVAGPLRAAGHHVIAPTLTGLGERAHLIGPGVGLRTHVDDVAGLVRHRDLRDVVLVGHSYAGFVVREVADRMPDRIGRLVMLDAWAGRDGESIDDRAPDWFRDWVASASDGDAIAVPPAWTVGVDDPADAAWLESRLTPQPRRTFAEPTRLTGAVDEVPCRAVVCVPGSGVPFDAWATEFGWDRTDLASGHDAMVIAPGEVARVLLDAA